MELISTIVVHPGAPPWRLPAWLWDVPPEDRLDPTARRTPECVAASKHERRPLASPDGWASNGAVALLVPANAGFEGEQTDMAPRLTATIAAATELAEPGGRQGASVQLGLEWVAVRYVELVARLYPGAQWYVAPAPVRRSRRRLPVLSAVIARLDGQPVAVVMPRIRP